MGISSFWTFVASVAQTSLVVFLLLGTVLGVAAGLMLIFASERAFRISDFLNRWVSTRAAMRPLDAYRSIKRPVYRMHRLVGSLICAGALYSLVVLGSPYGASAIAKSLSTVGPPRFASWIAESLTLFLLIGNFGALVFGLVLIFRPSALKRLETWADRQVSTRKPTKPLETQHFPLDEFARARPRLMGLLVFLGSVFVMASVGYPLLR